MTTATINVPMDERTAAAFAAASPEDRQKILLLLGIRLRELTSGSSADLKAIMDRIGANAEARGLTPAILESLLNG